MNIFSQLLLLVLVSFLSCSHFYYEIAKTKLSIKSKGLLGTAYCTDNSYRLSPVFVILEAMPLGYLAEGSQRFRNSE